MSLLGKISDVERKMIMNYIRDYSVTDMGCAPRANFEHLFRLWDAAKSANLISLFGDELILEKEICYKRDVSELSKDMDKIRHGHGSEQYGAAYDFLEALSNALRADPGVDNETRWRFEDYVFSSYGLAKNEYTEASFSATIAGKEIKVSKGGKVTRLLGKMAKLYNLEDQYEEFRLAHSRILNQKELKGHLCLSIHPLDYMTMSDNNCDWSSCMSWQESGCYRQGTVEMMNSPVVVVAYLTASNPMWVDGGTWNSKKWRELYIVSPEVITNVKAYPYKNTYLTGIVLDWLKELAEKNLGWTQFTDERISWYFDDNFEHDYFQENRICSVQFTTNLMYNDFDSDAGQISYFSKPVDGDSRFISICYSGDSECMCCGDANPYFDCEEYLVCNDCNPEVRCDNCGEVTCEDDLTEIDGEYLCESCYDRLVRTCLMTEENHIRTNMHRVGIVVDFSSEQLPEVFKTGLKVKPTFYVGWGEITDVMPVVDEHGKFCPYGFNTDDFYIDIDEFEEAGKRFSKKGEFEKYEDSWSTFYYIRVEDMTQELIDLLGDIEGKDYEGYREIVDAINSGRNLRPVNW